MSTTDSGEDSSMALSSGRQVLSREKSNASKVERLTSTLMDTNRNLREVDKMLEQYRDLGEQKAAVVDVLKADLRRSGVRQYQDSMNLCDTCQSTGDVSSGRLLSSPIRRRRQSCERCTASDRESGTSRLSRRGNPAVSQAVRFFDDMDIGDRHVHSLHQSIRDLSSEQFRLQQELERERIQRQRLEINNEKSSATSLPNASNLGLVDVKQLESLQNELRAERQVWRTKHDDLCKISSELKQALLDRRRNPAQTLDRRTDITQPFGNMLVSEDGEKQRQTSVNLLFRNDELRDRDWLTQGNLMRTPGHIQTVEQQLSAKELLSSRQLEQMQRSTEQIRLHMQESINDLQRQLRDAKAQLDKATNEKESLQNHLDLAKNKIEEQKNNSQELLQQSKGKNKKLEKELETTRKNMQLAESKLVQCEREMETFRNQNGNTSQQFEQLKRQFNDVLGIRVHLDEQVRAKDCELNQLKSVKLDLDKDLRDCRSMVERLENDLRSSKERVYTMAEEKNRLEDKLNSLQSNVFTSDHQLHSLQKELQDASVNNSHMSVQMVKLATENQELKLKLQEQQMSAFAGREEFNNLHQRLRQTSGQDSWSVDTYNQQLQGRSPKAMQVLIRRLKSEYAECYAELQTFKVALEEERTVSSRHKNQGDVLQSEINQLSEQLAASQEELAAMQQQYYKLRHELLSDTTRQWSMFEKGQVDI